MVHYYIQHIRISLLMVSDVWLMTFLDDNIWTDFLRAGKVYNLLMRKSNMPKKLYIKLHTYLMLL